MPLHPHQRDLLLAGTIHEREVLDEPTSSQRVDAGLGIGGDEKRVERDHKASNYGNGFALGKRVGKIRGNRLRQELRRGISRMPVGPMKPQEVAFDGRPAQQFHCPGREEPGDQGLYHRQ